MPSEIYFGSGSKWGSNLAGSSLFTCTFTRAVTTVKLPVCSRPAPVTGIFSPSPLGTYHRRDNCHSFSFTEFFLFLPPPPSSSLVFCQHSEDLLGELGPRWTDTIQPPSADNSPPSLPGQGWVEHLNTCLLLVLSTYQDTALVSGAAFVAKLRQRLTHTSSVRAVAVSATTSVISAVWET